MHTPKGHFTLSVLSGYYGKKQVRKDQFKMQGQSSVAYLVSPDMIHLFFLFIVSCQFATAKQNTRHYPVLKSHFI